MIHHNGASKKHKKYLTEKGEIMNNSSRRIEELIEKIAVFTENNGTGFTRFSYTDMDIEARRLIIEEMTTLNLDVYMDYLGNIFGRREGKNKAAPAILIGSHLDTVKDGGKYDGVAGVIAGIEVVRLLTEKNIETENPIEVIAFAEEEGGRFHSAFVGSNWIAGNIKDEDLSKYLDDNGVSIEEASKSLDVLNPIVKRCWRREINAKAMFELHCEQGTVLENEKISLGIVSSITGSSSFRVTLKGMANHAGTIPMNLRRDAFYGASLISVELNRYVKTFETHSVGTIGNICVKPNAYNIIPGEVSFSMDIRSLDENNMFSIINHMKAYIEKIALENKLDFEIKENHLEYPVKMSKELIDALVDNARNNSYSYKVMGSGAGHDTIVMNEICDTVMVFVPSKDGRSHCKEEYSSPRHIAMGCDIIMDTIIKI